MTLEKGQVYVCNITYIYAFIRSPSQTIVQVKSRKTPGWPVYHSSKTHTHRHTHIHRYFTSPVKHTQYTVQWVDQSRQTVRRICSRVLVNLSTAIGVFIRIFVKGTQIMRSEPSETTVLSYDFIKSAIKCSLVWGGGSDKPSFFFLSELCSSWSASCWGTVGMLVGKLPTWDVSVWETQIPQGLLVMKACGYSVLV